MKEKENYMKLSVQELKNLLKQKRKKVCGKKEVLVDVNIFLYFYFKI